MNKYIIKIDRISAWVLFVSLLLYFVSGYGMTKGIISRQLASDLHLSILTYFVLVAFTIHTSYAIHLAFRRWKIWNLPGKALLIIFFATFLGFFAYVDRYYSQNSVRTNLSDDSSKGPSVATSAVASSQNFTASELAKFNGQNGAKAYVAVDGDVYDVTALFANGFHFSHFAGSDLTGAFYSRHAKNSIAKYPIVGKLVN